MHRPAGHSYDFTFPMPKSRKPGTALGHTQDEWSFVCGESNERHGASSFFEVMPPTVLHAGQAQHLHVRAGTVVHVLRGEITLVCPLRWLADAPFRGTMRLGEGEVHPVEPGGWLTLRADTEAEWIGFTPPTLWQRLRRRVRASFTGCGWHAAQWSTANFDAIRCQLFDPKIVASMQ